MAQSINLIPQQERKEQAKVKAVKAGTVFSVLILLIVGGISAFLYWQTSNLQKESAGADERIQSLRRDIADLAQIEISARNLDAKYRTVKAIFEDRVYYSILFDELKKRVPSNVEIDNLSVSEQDGSINLSGQGSDYISIAQFIKTLSDQNFPTSREGLSGLFTNVTLNTVNLDSQNSSAKYFIVVEINEELLRR